MIDHAGRTIDYARISITGRCDMRCVYCMPRESAGVQREEALLSPEEIGRAAQAFSLLGVKYLKLTGGEPMARPDCLDIISRLRDVPGIEQVTMTTNGLRLAGRVKAAKAAGLSALNVSLDTLNKRLFQRITGTDGLRLVLKTIGEALEWGVPVKVNCVPLKGLNEEGLSALCALGRDAPIQVRFIELMPMGGQGALAPVPQEEIMERLSRAYGPLTRDPARHGNGPAAYYALPGFQGRVGFISAVSHEFCGQCNRVRLTAQGELKLCLNHQAGLDLRPLLKAGAGAGELSRAMEKAVYQKPLRHGFEEPAPDRETKFMYQLGG